MLIPVMTQALELLGDPTRVHILLSLATARDETPDHPVRSFSAIREAVGTENSGNVAYHLRWLEGNFAYRTNGGYGLTGAGSLGKTCCSRRGPRRGVSSR